jgi:hypothetical protein
MTEFKARDRTNSLHHDDFRLDELVLDQNFKGNWHTTKGQMYRWTLANFVVCHTSHPVSWMQLKKLIQVVGKQTAEVRSKRNSVLKNNDQT